MKIYITRKIPDIGVNILREKGFEIDINPEDRVLTKSELIENLSKKPYDAVITLLTDQVDNEVFDACPTAKIFANYAVGFNNIDIQEAKKSGIVITNTPGDLTDSVAEHSLALLFALSNKIIQADHFVRSGQYKGWNPNIFLRDDFTGKVVGIVGAGRIGFRFGHILNKGFGLKIIYYDVVRNEKLEKELGAEFYENVDDVFKKADFVSINVPLLETTKHLVNKKRLAMMKSGAYLINTSRGPVVDETALVEALKNGIIAGAGLDVFENEPELALGLKDLENVVLTPHIASATNKAREDMAVIACQNVLDFLEGREVKNKVS